VITLDRADLDSRLGALSGSLMQRVDAGIRLTLDL
jgi:mRNA-degrading endonuclease toxin of MazEF toxin-antitoxin module